MALPHARPGEVITLPSPDAGAMASDSRALIKTHALELIRLVLQPGERRPPHHVYGELVLQCLHGDVRLVLEGGERLLQAGQLVLLPAKASYALEGLKAAVLLMTVQLPAGEPGSGSSTGA